MRIGFKLTKRTAKTEKFDKFLDTNIIKIFLQYTDCIKKHHLFNPQLEAYETPKRIKNCQKSQSQKKFREKSVEVV